MIDTFCTLQSIKKVLLPRFAAKRRSNLRGRRSAAAIFADEQAKKTYFVFREGGVTASNIREQASENNKLYFSRNYVRLRAINASTQTQRETQKSSSAVKRRCNTRGQANENDKFYPSRKQAHLHGIN